MIQSDRIILRRFVPEDWQDLYAYLSDPEVVRFEPYDPLSAQDCRREAKKRAETNDFLAINLHGDKRMIGNIYLAPREFDAWVLGYILHPAYQKQGYATEAANLALDLAFYEYGAHRVFAQCNPLNTASWHLLERLGMRREAHFVQNVSFSGDPQSHVWQDTYEYAMLDTDHQKLKNTR